MFKDFPSITLIFGLLFEIEILAKESNKFLFIDRKLSTPSLKDNLVLF